MKYFLILSVAAASALCSTPQMSVPFVFEKNTGQVDPSVRFFSRTPRATLWLTESEVVLSIDQKDRRRVLRMKLDGASPGPEIEGARPLAGRSNYFIGRDPVLWRTDVPHFAAVRYRDAYPGIDLLFHAEDQTLEYDWIVAPGADVHRIHVSFEGSKSVHIDPSGDLVLSMSGAEIREKRPHIDQDGREIPGRWVRRGRSYGFEVGEYNPSRALTIDPVLTYSTYLGGSGNTILGDDAWNVAVDSQGNVVVVGTTTSANFPVRNAYESSSGAFLSGFITKLNPAGSGALSVVWSTYFGGPSSTSGGTQALAVAVDSQNNVYVSGTTNADDLPVAQAFQSFNAGYNCQNGGSPCNLAFVAKLSAAGNQLMYSSYLGGGNGNNLGSGIAVDRSGNAWVVGYTWATDFPVRGNWIRSNFGGGSWDGFVSQVSPDGSQLLYSTYLGGTGADHIYAVAVDAAGNAYVCGSSQSADFPTTTNAYQPALPSASFANGVVAKINANASPSLLYSTFLNGKTQESEFNAIAVDSKGNVWVGGDATSTDYPVTTNGIQSASVLANSGDGGIVSELNPSAPGVSQLEYSTFLSGGISDGVEGLGFDASGRVVAAGYAQSGTFLTTPDGFQTEYWGQLVDGQLTSMGFLSIIDPTIPGTKGLVYSTLFGGTSGGFIAGLAVNPAGTIAAVVGLAESTDMFVTPNAFQTSLQTSLGDGLVAVFNLAQSGPVINNMLNAASFDTATTSFAPGEIVAVFGSNLGPQTIVGGELDSTGHLANTLAGCQLLVNGVAAPLVYVQASVVSAILPYELTPRIGLNGNYAQMVCNGVPGNTFQFRVAAAQPGIFSAMSSGTGPAAILNADGSFNTSANPAAQGSIVALYATGEGVLTPAGQDGRIETGAVSTIPKPLLPLTVTFGGIASPSITYAGVAPGEVDGLLQVNAQVPSGLTPGNVPITISLGGISSQTNLTIAVK